MSRWIAPGRAALEVARGEPRIIGLRGTVGDALFACAFGQLDPLEEHAWVQRAIDELQTHGGEASLHGGIAGLGLVVAMYRSDDAEDLLTDLDAILIDEVAGRVPASVQSGAAGIGLYASVRSHAPSGRALQRTVVEALRAAAVPSGGGLVWHTPTDYARSRGIDPIGEPVLEYGMLHGVGGTLVALAALAAQGDADSADLVRAGLRAAWTHARPDANRFGRILFGPDGAAGAYEITTPRWCNGDPGVLRALWLAARVVDDASSAERALAALRSDAAVDVARDRLAGVTNMCCGSAAVAQVYLRMHRETGEDVFRQANAALLTRCAAGLDALDARDFPFGPMGVLLALIAAESDAEPAWDGMLGMSFPRAGAR